MVMGRVDSLLRISQLCYDNIALYASPANVDDAAALQPDRPGHKDTNKNRKNEDHGND